MTNGAAIAVFSACQQSHPFDERRIPLSEEYVKIGRSVARLKPGTDNAIFDCKVLSRNHAVVWYEDQTFYMRDTKSSNGTFVNNQRLSKGSEESAPKPIYSGDIIQFGVDIVENAKKEILVTHGCIVAMVRLFYPDGTEAVNPHGDSTDASMSESGVSLAPSALPLLSSQQTLNSQELYQLQQYIREATHREQQLENKLQTLQSLLTNTHEASENSWQALVDEDRLLSRIEMLESQLQAYSKNATEDKLREQVQSMQEEKLKYENTAKESLRRALQEKVEAMQKLSDVERSLETTEETSARIREQYQAATNELEAISNKHNAAMDRVNELNSQIQEAERRYTELECRRSAELADLSSQLALASQREAEAKVEIDSAREQLSAAKQEDSEGNLETIDSDTRRQSVEAESYKKQLENCHKQMDGERRDMQGQIRRAREEGAHNAMQARTHFPKEEFAKIVESATNDLLAQLEDSLFQKERSEQLVCHFKDFGDNLEQRLRVVFCDSERTALPNGDCSMAQNGDLSPESNEIEQQLANALTTLENVEKELNHCNERLASSQTSESKAREEIESLRKEAQYSEHLLSQNSVKTDRLHAQLAEVETELEQRNKEVAQTKDKLQILSEEMAFERSVKSTSDLDSDKARLALHRQAAKNQAEFAALKEECGSLRQRIIAIEAEMRNSRKENCRLSSANRQLQESHQSLMQLKETLEAHENEWKYQADTAKYEADIVRNQLNEKREENTSLVQKSDNQKTEIEKLKQRLENSGYDFDYEELELRARTVTICSSVPLLVLAIALVLAYLPFFSWITATNDQL